MPPGSLGRAPEGTVVLDPETERGVPAGPLRRQRACSLNPDEAIGEIVNQLGAAGFEGYWKNDEANAARTRDGMYWTGDLAYQDEQGFVYFAGRDFEWLRVDGENFAAAPVERILARFPDVVLAAVYAVPDADVGDQVMAALQLRPARRSTPTPSPRSSAEQPDLGTKWAPRFVRIADELPVTPTDKVLKRVLRRERWETSDPVWWRPAKGDRYRRLTPDDVDELARTFAARGRSSVLAVS